ncbi:6321_t:CDS:1 [Paraglomus brasilianum]|uniref:6321_t:CDS:1 n=1 Tax=Paraglomus brasilianum TaxID=144538 RepID=A0A9N9CJX0_9GLOM|nr:6321_t:CDS:1 [Paraglomus brasilianum]
MENLNDEQCLIKYTISDLGMALAMIQRFVLEEAKTIKKILHWSESDPDPTANLPALPVHLEKRTKFRERTPEAGDGRLTEMVGDMSETELFNMQIRKKLKLLRDWYDIDQQSYVDQLLRQFGDDYENPQTLSARETTQASSLVIGFS